MRIQIKRHSLLAYLIFLSCASGLLWIVLIVTSDNVVSPLGSIKVVSEDGELDYGSKDLLKQSVGTDDVPEEGSRSSQIDSVLIPDSTTLRNMSWQDLSNLYHKYLNANQIHCENILRVGRVTDGGWDVCNDQKFAPSGDCVVYSFGIGDDFSFDDSVIKHFGCKVFSFDPSMSMESNLRYEKAYFYRQGIADSDRTLPNGWQMSRFESIRGGLKHMKIHINIVKMDIEEWEWEVLPDILASDHLASVDQLLLELHQCQGCSVFNPDQEDKEPQRDRYIHMLELLRELYKQNFRIFHHHFNPACNYLSKFTRTQLSACVDVGFVRIS